MISAHVPLRARDALHGSIVNDAVTYGYFITNGEKESIPPELRRPIFVG